MGDDREKEMRERIQYLFKNQGKKVNSVAIDKKEQRTLNRQINEETTISSKTIFRVLELFPECSINWLLTGKRSMEKASASG
ncbi:MAG: hypothetical protein LBG96_12075 [Tannerella sp.]|jgi:transposase|nr:hypothetical protein [Tannerella sp.]